MAVVNELVTKFSFQGSSKPLTNYNEALGTSIKIMASFATATLASAGAFARFVTNIAKSFDPLTQLSRTTGVAIEEIQKLGFVASQNGSDINAVTSSLESLSAKIGEAAQVGSAEFARLGISVRNANGEVKKADDVLMEVGQRFREMGLSRAEQISFAEKLGIDKSLIQTLNLSSEAMNKLKKQAEDLGVVTQKEANAMADLTDSVTVLKYGFDSIKNSIAVGFAPVLQELAESFTEFLGKNKELISEGLQKVGKWITTLAQAIVRLMPVIAGIGVAFLAFKVYTLGLSGALALLFSPVTLIIAGITALLFIVDDLIVAFRGGESVIANFFQEFFSIDIVPILQDIVDNLNKLMDVASNVLSFIGALFSSTFTQIKNTFKLFIGQISFRDWIDETIANFQGLLDPLKAVFDSIMGYIQPIIDGIKMITNFKIPSLNDIGSGIKDTASSVLDSAKSWFGFGSDEQQQIEVPNIAMPVLENTPDSQLGMENTPVMNPVQPMQQIPNFGQPQAPQGIASNNNVNQDVKIEIRTDDPVTAGRSVQNSLNEQLRDAQYQLKRGGM